MSYLVLARKYRPQSFSDVVQQEHVTKTLANAIETGRLAHAILFAGPRGTGKTTIARILAKAMNCEKGPAAIPCNVCRSCQEITAGHAADVFEIDGASNNSVDQVRELRENLKYMPVRSRYKIYIIDEVHMLSLAAFNALLKTLEEPPEHILFMFATTEVHKIPITILSRCQRHDLRRIDAEMIAAHLEKLCRSESVDIDKQSLTLIAKEAGGSMRDGLSLLDHILACVQGAVDGKSICELLGIVDRTQLFSLAEAILDGDVARVLRHIDTVWRQGYEMKRYYSDVVALFHDLSMLHFTEPSDNLVDLPEHEIEKMRGMVTRADLSRLIHIFDSLFQAEPTVKLANQPKYAVEIVFLRLFQQPPPMSVDKLIESLDKLREEVAGAPLASLPERPPSNTAPREAPAEPPVKNCRKSEKEQACENATDERIGNVMPDKMEGKDVWPAMLEKVREQKPSVAAILNKCVCKTASDRVMAIEVSGNEFTLNSVKKHVAYLETVANQVAKQPLKIEIIANIEDAAAKQEEKNKADQRKKDALSHPMVMEAIELFDGKVVDVKIP